VTVVQLKNLSALVAAIEAVSLLKVERWRDLGGSGTINLALDLGRGRTTVARVHRMETSWARVSAEQAVRRELAEKGMPTVVPDALCRLQDGRLLELEPYVNASDRMHTPDRLSAGFTLLARLHSALRMSRYPPAAAVAQHANHVHAEEAERLTRAGAERILAWPHPDLHPYAAQVVEHVAKVAVLEQQLTPAQVVQLVHGDYWDNNVLFAGQHLAAVLDFGFMGRRARIDDLALPFWFWLLEPGHGPPGLADIALLARLADAYDRGADHPLSTEERSALPLAVARQPAWSTGHWVLELDEAAAVLHARVAAQELPVAEVVLADLPRWQEALVRP
jgi:homoserine kinase type II